MANNTYTKIASYTVTGSGITQINFASIPQTYTDLYLVVSARTTTAAIFDYMSIALNNGTSAETTILQGTGSGVNASRSAGAYKFIINGANASANVFSNSQIYISNYTSTNIKQFIVNTVTENIAAAAYQEVNAIYFNQGANPTNYIQLSGSTYAIGTTATLYGIKNS